MEFLIQINVQSIAGIICLVCGLSAFFRAAAYMASCGGWDFFSPFLGFVAAILGIVEIVVGAFLIFLKASLLLAVFACVLAFFAILHSVIGYKIRRDIN